ncbi:MAG: ribosomal protein S18-alanine N-acetyltransferase [Bacillota bacterium]
MAQQPEKLPDDLVIEPMDGADVTSVSTIENSSFSDPWPSQSFYTELQSNQLAFYLVARIKNGEKAVAYIGAWQILDEVHITTLAVAEKYRRRGIATRLMEALIEATSSRGARYLTLEVRPSNKSAIKFYEKHGFKTLGRRKRYYADEDALIMTKEL